ncbi:spermatogenesis-associated protein 6 isoform X2 [Labeo rohita]|uniref:spermatogenesis-associated protein 6 isoform X2 n=1 Tax=Labeo rohita TaxID=84645 RepID=UPI0021E1E448|nr:spermatogenesis-associated protein 6 isoform X2 [Labeo rohita]
MTSGSRQKNSDCFQTRRGRALMLLVLAKASLLFVLIVRDLSKPLTHSIMFKCALEMNNVSKRVEERCTISFNNQINVLFLADDKMGEQLPSHHTKHLGNCVSCGRSSTKPCHVKTCPANAKKKPGTAPSCGYEKPTVASQSRAPSPYTHRKMCQLSEEARQRLSHFKLGPYIYKKETVPQAPFVVPRSPNTSLMESSMCFTPQSSIKRSPLHQRSRSYTTDLTDPSLLGSFRSKPSHEASMQATRSPQNKSPKDHSTPVSITLRDQSPVLSRSSLRERFQSSSSPSQSEEIHKRVQRILNIHGPRCKLSFDEESEEEEGVRQSSRVSSHRDSVIDSWLPQDRLIPAEPSVNLDGGTFWTKRAAAYTGKPHRAAFEDSLSKIYKNLYRNASQTGHSGQSTSTQ